MRLSKANAKATSYACKNFHYAKSTPAVMHSYNVYNDKDEWCGYIVFGGGANNNLAKSFALNNGEVLELERVALNGKQEYTSQAIAMALKCLHKDNPLVKLVVSYSDHRQMHIGTIYQATNWLYLGLTIVNDTQYWYGGKWTHERTINAKKNKTQLKKILPKRENSNKFKYVFAFDKKMRKELLKQSKPYPKSQDITKCTMQKAVAEKSGKNTTQIECGKKNGERQTEN